MSPNTPTSRGTASDEKPTEHATKADLAELRAELAELRSRMDEQFFVLVILIQGRSSVLPTRTKSEYEAAARAAPGFEGSNESMDHPHDEDEGVDAGPPTPPKDSDVTEQEHENIDDSPAEESNNESSEPPQAVEDAPKLESEGVTPGEPNTWAISDETENDDTVHLINAISKLSISEEPATLPEPFSILKAAIAAADVGASYAHVKFPNPHLPLPIPIDGVQLKRSQDLNAIHEIICSQLLAWGLLLVPPIGDVSDDSQRVEHGPSVTRSLSCAVEHFVAVFAITGPPVSVELAKRELLGETGATSWASLLTVQEWKRNFEKIQQDGEEAQRQEARLREETDWMDDVEVTMTGLLPLPQSTEPTPSHTMMDVRSQQNVQAAQSLSSSQAQPISITATNTASASSTSQTNRITLSPQDLEKLRPTRPQFPHLQCIPDDLRHRGVIEFYNILRSRNPSARSLRTRLSDDQVYEMALQSDVRILVSLNETLTTTSNQPTDSGIIAEYIRLQREMANDYRSSRRFTRLIQKFHESVRDNWTRARRALRQQTHAFTQQVGAFVLPARRWAGFPYRPQLPPLEIGLVGVTHGGFNNKPTSDKLNLADLTTLKQPLSPTTSGLHVSGDTRGETLVDFYDTLVTANTRPSCFKHDPELEMELATAYLSDGTAPFWNDFVPLSAAEILRLAKEAEVQVLEGLEKNVARGKLKSSEDLEYSKLASKLGISCDAKVIENFAMEAAKLFDKMEA